MLAQEKRWVAAAKYSDMIGEMSLSPERSAKLVDLLIARDQAVSDARAVGREKGIQENSPMGQQSLANAAAEVDQEIAKALGPDDYQRYQAVRSSEEMQTSLANLGITGAFVEGGKPLTQTQLRDLANVYTSVEKDYGLHEGTALDPATVKALKDELLSRAASVLGEDQVKILQQRLQFDLEFDREVAHAAH